MSNEAGAGDGEHARKSHTEYFTFNTKKKRERVHLTPRLEDLGF